MKSFKYAIALTGSIATGKSSVAKIFKEFGFNIIDADKIAHDILDIEHSKISKMFGKSVVLDGKVDRKALGQIVFNDISKRKELERLLHPLIYDTIEKEAIELDAMKKPYLVDIPLFFETNRYPIEKSLVVYIPKNIELERLQNRDNISKDEALLRIDMQISIEKKSQDATYIIDNSGTLLELKQECYRTKNKIEKDFI